jgi:predicted glycoside hydrolase/deacetylase ChbG (UPF0249 family)
VHARGRAADAMKKPSAPMPGSLCASAIASTELATSIAERFIAICADDFGLHRGVNQAVLQLAERGRISAASCMVGAPAWPEGAAALRELDTRGIDVGLHLDLTERPLNPSLRKPLAQWLALAAVHAPGRAALRAEINAQLDRFEQALGRAPAHVDGHQHVHQFPAIREVLVELLAERYRDRLPWLRNARRPPGAAAFGKPWLIERLGCAGLSRLASEHGFAQNRNLLGVYNFAGGAADYLARLAAWLEAAQPGDLLICHPATAGDADDAILAARLRECEVLTGAAFGELLARSRLRVGPLGSMAANARGG